jgi:2,5-furandicarboxylate decarboxylase 1
MGFGIKFLGRVGMFADLRSFLDYLEAEGELVRIRDELSPQYEIPAAISYISRYKGAAVFCEKVKGYQCTVVGNLLGSQKRLAMAFGVREEELLATYRQTRTSLIKPQIVSQGPVKEIVMEKDIDLFKTIPALTHFEHDGSPYLTAAFIIAQDPVTGIRGMGIHRIQLKDKDTVGIFIANPPLSHFLTKSEKINKPLEIAIVIGTDPLTFLASIVFAPEGIDKLEIAGSFNRSPVELVSCQKVKLEIPARAEFVLEGYIIPHVREPEGPFGESRGYYFSFDSPVAKIVTITHRHSPVYHALMPFGTKEIAPISHLLSSDTIYRLQEEFPQIKNICYRGIGAMAIVELDKKEEDDPIRIIEHLLSNQPYLKWVVVTDGDIDIFDPEEVDWALTTRVRLDKDIIIKTGMPGSLIDPLASGKERIPGISTLIGRTSKIGIDATKPLDQKEHFKKVSIPTGVNEKVMALLKKTL